MKTAGLLWISVCFFSLSIGHAHAQEIKKDNNTNALNTAASWVGGIVPSNTNVAVWDATVTSQQTVNTGSPLTWDGIRITNPGGTVMITGTNKLTLDGGAALDLDLSAATQGLTISAPLVLTGSHFASVATNQTLTFSGTTDVFASLYKTNSGLLVLDGPTTITSDFRIAGGTALLRSNTVMTAGGGETMGIYNGAMILDGGSFNMTNPVNSRFFAGRALATSDAMLIISNGTHRIEGGSNDSMANFVGVSNAKRGRLFMEGGRFAVKYLRLAINTKGGQVAGAPDEIVVNGGTLAAEGSSIGFMMTTAHSESSGGDSSRSGRLIINGGRFEIPNGATRIAADATANIHSGAADVYLNGGVWSMKQLRFGTDTNVTRSLTFNGGTLEATNIVGGAEFITNPPPFKVQSRGAILSAAAGSDCRMTVNLEQDPASVGGPLIKTGAGRIMLVGAHTLSGQTIISNGVFGLSASSFPQTNLIVESGATLSLADGVLAPFSPTSLRIGLGTLPSHVEIEVAASGSACDQFVIPVGAWIQRIAFDLITIGTRNTIVREGDFPVLSYLGTAPALANLSWGNPTPGFLCTFSIDSGSHTVIAHIRADSTSGEAFWLNSTGGAWSTAANWNTSPLSAVGNGITFGTFLAAADTVTLDTPFTLGRMTFNNAHAYTLSGAGALTFDNGSAGASITVSNGSHTVSVPVALSSTLTANVSTSPSILLLNTTISGAGGIIKTGAGDLELVGTNTYAGGTTLSSGNITVRQPGVTFGTGPIVLAATLGGETGRLRNRSTALLTITNDVIVAAYDASIEANTAPVLVTGAFDFNGSGSFSKAGVEELILTGLTQESGNYKLNIRTGSVRIGAGGRFLISNSSARDTIYLSDNTSSPRAFTVDAGAEVIAGGLYTGSAASNTIFVNGGNLTLTGSGSESGLIRASSTDPTDGTDRIIVDNNGTFTVTPGRWFSMGVRNGGSELIVNAGSASIGNLSFGVRSDSGYGSTGPYTYANVFVNGGTLDITGVLNWLGDIRDGRTNLITVNNGTLRLPVTIRSAPLTTPASASYLTLNGGTLVLTGANNYNASDFANYLDGLSLLLIDQGGAIIDTLANNVTITQTLQRVAATTGGLTKRGSGSLTFSAPSTYVGATTVENGSLHFAAGSTMTGLTLAQNTTLSLCGNTFDSVTLSTASFGANARINLDVSASGTTCDTLALPSGATSSSLVIGLYNMGTSTPATTLNTAWPIFSYAGTPPDVSSWQLASDCFGAYQFTTNTTAQTIEVTLLNSTLFATWANTGAGTWSTAANWAPDAPATAGATVRFGPALTADATVTVDAPVSIAGLRLENSARYTLAGSTVTLDNGDNPATLNVLLGSHTLATPLVADNGATLALATGTALQMTDELTGTGALEITGGGALALDGTNHIATTITGSASVTAPTVHAFDGAITVNGGSIAIAQSGTFAQSIVLGENGGTFSAGAGQTVTASTAVSGNGSLTKTSSGILDLGANAAYTGATTVNGGSLLLTALPAGPLTFGGGTFSFTGTESTAQPVTIDSNTNAAVVTVAGDLTLSGPITTTKGGILKRGTGTLHITGATQNQIGMNTIGNIDQVALSGDDGNGPANGVAGLNIAEGTLVLGAAGQTNLVLGDIYVGLNTTTNASAETAGNLIIAGGYTVMSNFLCIGRNNGSTVTAPQGLSSRVSIEAGTVIAQCISLSANTSLGSATYTGHPELVVTGGTLHVTDRFYAGNAPGSVCTITVAGGYLRYDGLLQQSLYLGQGGGEGILRITGGTAEFANDVILGYSGAGNTGTLELSGGELIAKRVYSLNTTSYSRILFNGGVFKPVSGGLDTTIDVTQIGAGPAIFDTSRWTGSDSFNLSATLTSAGGSDGGLVKTGTGTLRISAPQSYVGPTVVSNGTLWVLSTGTLPASSALNVMPGATFQIGNLPCTNVTVSALTLGSATDSTPAQLGISFNYVTGKSDQIIVTGDVTAHHAVISCIWRGSSTEKNVPNGSYTLISWTGNGPSTADAFSIADPIPGKAYTLAIVNKALVLTVGPSTSGVGAYVWAATGSGNWSDNTKWVAAPGSGAAGAVVRLDTTVTAPATVTLDQATTAGQLYLNSSNSYTLANAGQTLTVDNSGNTALIHLEQGRHTISAPMSLAEPAKVQTYAGSSLTLSGNITGNGSLIKDGGGDLLISSSANSFTGGIHLISSGAVILTNGANTGSGPVSFEADSTLRSSGTTPVSVPGGLSVRTTASSIVEVGAQAPVTASGLSIPTNSSLTKTGTGDLIFSGSAEVTSDTSALLKIRQGTVRFAAGSNYRIGQSTRDGIYMSDALSDAKGLTVDAGAMTALSGIYSGHGTNTQIIVNGQLDLIASNQIDALVLRVQDSNYEDRVIVNASGVINTPNGGTINVGVRGPAGITVNGGQVNAHSMVLGYQSSLHELFGGRFAHVRTTSNGLLNVTGRYWWMADSNNVGRINWLIADNGGTARLPNTLAQHATGWTSFILDNGIFQAAGTGANTPIANDYLAGLKTFFIGPKGGTINTDGKDVALSQKVAFDTETTLTKTGTGALSLSQTLAWPGMIDVQAGVVNATVTSGLVHASMPTNLIAHYSNESAPGVDSSGYARHGTAWGGVITSVSDVTTNGIGLNFPSGSIITVPNDGTLRGMDNYTVGMWVKVASVTSGGTVSTFFTTRMGNGNDAYQIMMRTLDGKLYFMASSPNGGWTNDYRFASTLSVPAGAWFHAAAAVSSTGLKLYVNGQPAGSWTKNGIKFSPPTRAIGDLGFGIGHPYLTTTPTSEFSGQVDDVQIYNRTLSDAEVAAIVAAPTPVEPSLRIAQGASIALSGATTVRTLSGEGYMAGGTVTVLDTVSPGDTTNAPGAVYADSLVLSDGATYRWDWTNTDSDVIHTKQLTLGASGFLDFGREPGHPISDSFRTVLATYDTLTGAANLSNWTIINPGGQGFIAEVTAANGEIVLNYIARRGTLIILR